MCSWNSVINVYSYITTPTVKIDSVPATSQSFLIPLIVTSSPPGNQICFLSLWFFSFSRILKKWKLTIWRLFPVLSRYNRHTALKASIIMIWLTYCEVITTVSLGKICQPTDMKQQRSKSVFPYGRTLSLYSLNSFHASRPRMWAVALMLHVCIPSTYLSYDWKLVLSAHLHLVGCCLWGCTGSDMTEAT